MAIEIRELVIKMTIADKAPVKQVVSGQLSDAQKKQFLNECVQKVLDKLDSKIER
jgi:hypothetical protein